MRSFSLFYIYGSALYQLVGYTICDAIISSSNFFLPLGFFFQYDTRILYETRILSHLDKKPRDKTTQFIYWPAMLTHLHCYAPDVDLQSCPVSHLDVIPDRYNVRIQIRSSSPSFQREIFPGHKLGSGQLVRLKVRSEAIVF